MYEIQGNGEWAPPGRPPVVLEHYFTSGAALPSWLTVPEGTATITAQGTSSQGTITVTTGAVVGNAAQLRAMDVDPSRWACIDFRLIEFSAGASDVVNLMCDMYFQMRSTSGSPAGCDFKQLTTDPNLISQIAGVTSPVASAPANIRATLRTQGEAKNRRTIGMLWYPQDKQVVYYEGDPRSERGARVHSGLAVGNVVAPRFRMVTQEATARGFSVAGVRLALHPY